MRTVASRWEKWYTKTMDAAGWWRATTSSSRGQTCDLKWVEATLWKKYVVKMRAMYGPERTEDKVADMLKRVVEWKTPPRGTWRRMLNDMELQEYKESTVSGSKTAEQEDNGELLDWESTKRYRSIFTRGKFLAQDRPDIRYTVKELCR